MTDSLVIQDLAVGMLLSGMFREFDYQDRMRVEFVAHDWAVARDDEGTPHFLTDDSNITKYQEGEG